MLNRGWGRLLVCVVALAAGIQSASAQDASRDKEIEELKRRLEALESQKSEPQEGGASMIAAPLEEKWFDRVHVGGGVRTAYRAVETPTGPSSSKYSSDFVLESGRLYTGGKISDVFSATLNAEFTIPGGAQVLDAIAQMKVSDAFNIFVGRHLPATDRSNSDGPYYLSTWDFPFLSDGFNASAKAGDRDDGVTAWGDIGNFKYWVGLYEGADRGAPSAAFPNDALMFAARIQFNFMDAETGYYLSSTYYGDKKILAIGLVANYQAQAAGTVADPAPAANVCLDFLWEQKLDILFDGVITTEAAFYYFGRHGYGAAEGGVSPIDVGSGTGVLLSVAYLIPGKLGWGQFQPHIRYQGFDESEQSAGKNVTSDSRARVDIGVNYVMQGHNARISLVYSRTDVNGASEFGAWVLGTQFQF